MNQSAQPLFIGYAEPAALLEAIDLARPLYANLIGEPETARHGMTIERILITLAQPDLMGMVHYCRIPLTTVSTLSGVPFEPDYEQRRNAARQAFDLTRLWLIERGATLRDGTIAGPKDYRYLDGDAPFLLYDRAFSLQESLAGKILDGGRL